MSPIPAYIYHHKICDKTNLIGDPGKLAKVAPPSMLMFGQNSSGLAWEAVLWPFFENRCELALQAA
jgi:hypothetical protein